MIIQGNALALPLADESVSAIVCDPPYGLSFMGREWDRGVPGVPFWTEAMRVAKPGAHLLAFGGTRTYHRLTCAIEDAGWEIRDCLMWVYGSGFPKSHDVSKAIDREAGEEREVVGIKKNDQPTATDVYGGFAGDGRRDTVITTPATPKAAQWEGWGTALKPAVEYIVMAQKPLDLRGHCVKLAHRIGECVCQLQSNASTAGSCSASSPPGRGAASDSALWPAVPRFSTPADLFAAMDTLRSGMALPSSLNTALSWLDILGATWTAANTFTTETATGLTTDLKILNCSPSPITPEGIIEAGSGISGIGSSAALAANIFSVVGAKLASTLTRSAHGPATSSGGGLVLRPDWRPIILARKPFRGSVAQNVLAHGCGALNIDGCRIETDETWEHGDPGFVASGRRGVFFDETKGMNLNNSGRSPSSPLGRWPANLLHDGSDEVLAGFPETGKSSGGSGEASQNPQMDGHTVGWMTGIRANMGGLGDSGSAARYFYCAKASRAERDAGLHGFGATNVNDGRATSMDTPYQRGDTQRRNIHPTVKPVSLMRYLIRLVTPPGGIVLDNFAGSGTTGCGCAVEGVDFVGVELAPEHVAIAERRIAWHVAHRAELLRDGGKAYATKTETVDERQGSLF
jgi:DNA modification methylase